jgi:hypothetical protein
LELIGSEVRLIPFQGSSQDVTKALNAAFRLKQETQGKGVAVKVLGEQRTQFRSALLDHKLWTQVEDRALRGSGAKQMLEFIEDQQFILDLCSQLHDDAQRRSATKTPNDMLAVEHELSAFQRLVDSWENAEGGLDWITRHPEDWAMVNEVLETFHFELQASRTKLILATRRPRPTNITEAAQKYLVGLFVAHVTGRGPEIGRCKGCGRYFTKTNKRTEYHDLSCARKTTAKAAKDAARHLKIHRKLLAVIKIIENIPSSAVKDWKSWVVSKTASNHSIETVTRDWLTRITNQKNVSPATECGECQKFKTQICEFAAKAGDQ